MSQSSPPRPVVSDASKSIRVQLILANQLDRLLFLQLLEQVAAEDLEVVGATCDFEFGLNYCQRTQSDVLVLDPKAAPGAVAKSLSLCLDGCFSRLILIDDRLREGLVADILDYYQVSYLTRDSSSEVLVEAIRGVVTREARFFDPDIARRILRTPRGWHFQGRADNPTVALLTAREKQVLRLLAQGKTVRGCAEQLRLSQSTIDNHKSRLMKKLKLHKATELTQVAIRDGLLPSHTEGH
jgi:two-component system, NarL family, response regulator NreC